MRCNSNGRPFNRSGEKNMKQPHFTQALQAPIYLISVLPILAVVTLTGASRWAWVIVAGLGVIFLQHAVNVLNDVTDWSRGADVEKIGSWVRYHRGEKAIAARHGWFFVGAGLLTGMVALWAVQQWEVLWVAAPLVVLGLSYNLGANPLAYGRWGEWATGLCYGPGVAGCLTYVAVGKVEETGILLSLAFGFLAVAMLLNHQPPQVLNDSLAGKHCFAVRHGARATYRTARGLFALSVFLFVMTFLRKGSL